MIGGAGRDLCKEEFVILNSLYDAAMSRAGITADVFLNKAQGSMDTLMRLRDAGYVDRESGALTEHGLAALEPYRVDNAVILAAGSATRFIPLSLEQPKALYEVRGEKLIERQIQQLQEAGIRDITVVLGYKKEMFSYLREKYGVRFIFNPSYNIRNNIESLYLARAELKNTYICTCDSYFTENPFHQFEYQSFNAGYSTPTQESEMYVRIDETNRIIEMQPDMDGGLMLLGHAYWQADFSAAFTALAEADRDVGKYRSVFWEWMVMDKLGQLPPFYFKEYAPDSIYEFDYFEQLRQFDTVYVGHARSEILRNIKLVFRCDEEDIIEFRNIHEGLTNTSFIFRIDGTDYIYRHPGEGTERIINRRNEKQSLIRAKEYGIDPTYIYMDVIEGWKISRFVSDFRVPDYSSFEDSKRVIALLRKLHSLPVRVEYGLDPWEDGLVLERLVREKDPESFLPYEKLKARVETLYRRTQGDSVEKCFCHGDTYRPNWMLLPDGGVILIDWEYSGFSDPGVDVGYYIVDAMYEEKEGRRFIREYLGDDWTEEKEFHFMAYTAIIAYYWFVWAVYRESCGADIGDVRTNWLCMAQKYTGYLTGDLDEAEN